MRSRGCALPWPLRRWAEVLSADAFAAFEEVGLDNEDAVSGVSVLFSFLSRSLYYLFDERLKLPGLWCPLLPARMKPRLSSSTLLSPDPPHNQPPNQLVAGPQVANTGRRFRDTVLALGGGRAPDLVFKVRLAPCRSHPT